MKNRLLSFLLALSFSCVATAHVNTAQKTSCECAAKEQSFLLCAIVRAPIFASFGVTSRIRSITSLTSWENKNGGPCWGALADTPHHRAVGQQTEAAFAAIVGAFAGVASCFLYR